MQARGGEQGHADGGPRQPHHHPDPHTHPRADAVRHVQHAVPGAGAHPVALPRARLHSHHAEQHEGDHEADQKDPEQGNNIIYKHAGGS